MPLSDDPSKRQRQLANLKQAPPAPRRNARARVHGGYAQVAEARLDASAREVFAAVASDAPLRGPDGELPASDAVAVRLLADCLCRLDDVSANIRDHGLFDAKTKALRPVVELERRLRQEAREHAGELGLTPRSRVALGLDLARGADLATAMAEDAERELAELEANSDAS